MMGMMEEHQQPKRVGSTKPETYRLRLVWWPLPSTAADKGWGNEPPHCREVTVEVLGIWSLKKSLFTAHAVFPTEPLPPMNPSARSQFIRATRNTLGGILGVKVEGISNDIIEWEAPQ